MKKYQNGDLCPCCGQPLEGLSDECLDLFSKICALTGLSDLEEDDVVLSPIDTGPLKPPDAGLNPPVKPIGKW